MFVGINGSQQLTTSQQIIAHVQSGLNLTVTAVNFNACGPSGIVNVTIYEGFSNAFMKRNVATPSDFATLLTPAITARHTGLRLLHRIGIL